MSNCIDLFQLSQEHIIDFLNDDDSNVIILYNEHILCYSLKTLDFFVNDPDDTIRYPCEHEDRVNPDNVNMNSAFVKIPVTSDGMNVFVTFNSLYTACASGSPVLKIVPIFDSNGIQISHPYTVSFNNVYPGRTPNYVSKSHCQTGSNILAFKIVSCGEMCQGENAIVNASIIGKIKNEIKPREAITIRILGRAEPFTPTQSSPILNVSRLDFYNHTEPLLIDVITGDDDYGDDGYGDDDDDAYDLIPRSILEDL